MQRASIDSYLSQANIHSFLESDDRINVVVNFLDEALAQLDSMDSMVQSYKIHLNVRSYTLPIGWFPNNLFRMSAMIFCISNLKTVDCKCRHKTNRLF